MPRLLMPTRRTVIALAAIATGAAIALLVAKARDLGATPIAPVAGGLAAGLALLFLADAAFAAWQLRRHPILFERQMPSAFALGQPHGLVVTLSHEGTRPWKLELFDHVPATMTQRLLPASVVLPAASRLDVRYEITPTQRGKVVFEPAAIRVRSRLGLADLQLRIGAAQSVQVYPNFAALSRYAWLAGDRRLAEIGIKSYIARGAGTDFKQLGEYVPGMPTRHIDWNASMRHRRPVVREYQDDRDQAVMFLLDCGRRMRADERSGHDGSHFDQALNAAMLLAYVALKDGDAVGAMTFGHDASQQRHFAPAKGMAALNSLVARLHDIEPSPTHSDYLAAARDLMLRVRRRSLVVVLTNFRDEDCEELEDALKLMRTRHLVLLASLKEGVVAEIASQPMDDHQAIVDVAAAHWFQNARAEAFRRLSGKNQLLVDVEPSMLAATLVNRYHAVKRARLL
ncbi:DUF58 domain-containing protein [Scleromatobacter humisilvae]|uniref:DUF58 domain-containing protein n=1 Tax=Scleromatobacter humisilvae TaxID=2897159 RepID=A0A9X1YSE5_9BURK|nr:DUF58 domain-containing protein [Scleromatobacter humisilvae]MCK9688281.1 DUF58 domain-containing protein [Scleromatobacter humisilvae]